MGQAFIVTKEHRRFTEFANAVRKERTIGICHGDAGVGKTQSARRYANWDTLEPYIDEWGPRSDADDAYYALANRSRTVFYTPEVLPRPKELVREISHRQRRVDICVEEHQRTIGNVTGQRSHSPSFVELLIIDEAERLTPMALELLRDQHDRTHLAIILVGMPGIDQRFRHYPQLYSRLGFSHHYRTLGRDELLFVLDRHWKRIGRSLDPEDFTDAQAIAAIERITRGNFRLLERLFPQIARVLKINQLETITDDVVKAAASILVIGDLEQLPHEGAAMRLIGYVRASRPQPSADRQRLDLMNAGVAACDIYTDHDADRTSPSRPQLHRALNALRPGDTLTIDTLERLGRSTQTVVAVADELQTRGAGLRVLDLAGGTVDTSTATGSMLFTTLAALAQMERELKRERARDSVERRRHAGNGLGGRPLVFTDDQIRRAVRLVEEGQPAAKVAFDLGMSRTTFYRRSRALDD